MKYSDDMSEDVLFRVRCQNLNRTLPITAENYNETFLIII